MESLRGTWGYVMRSNSAVHYLNKRLDHLQIVEGALVWLEDNSKGE